MFKVLLLLGLLASPLAAQVTPSQAPELQQDGNRDLRPVPDPTELTTQQLKSEVAALREILESKIDGDRDAIEARLAGMDKAIQLLQAIADRMPEEIDGKIANLQRFHEEKFSSIQTQFEERDVRTDQSSRATETAVNAALQAAKEAVEKQNAASDKAIAKSETATKEQIDQLGNLSATETRALRSEIEDAKSRIDRIEAASIGERGAVQSRYAETSNTGTIISIIVGALIIAGFLFVGLVRKGPKE